MIRIAFLFSAFLMCALFPVTPAASQDERITVVLADFSFTPDTLRFAKGQHYRLHLENRGSGGHNFSSPEFFSAVRIDEADQDRIAKGRIEVPKNGAVDIGFTAVTPGEYRLRCTHFLHTGFGMKGKALID
jgi:uncharacterized cupredoxin-like copper-binding protein